ncbi:hypothetical protein [Streptomyces sp. NPDC056387]|uniref:hypothetical protein n=1 Tax=Streptomyces sp. NPDC056387 TaxID=3345803 RepID=UPI0035DB54D3
MPTVPTPHDHALPVETLAERAARLEAERPPVPWPFSLNDPVRAVHFALEPDCPYSNPAACPYETTVTAALAAYKAWVGVHPHAAP